MQHPTLSSTHAMNVLAGGKSRGHTGDGQAVWQRMDKGQNVGLAMHWQAMNWQAEW